ncbi:MAG: hypothetical protein AB7I27_16050 [Bacteriovoracaceae bacterium]
MKLAILGSSPISLEAALRFNSHGAAITWFNFEEIEIEEHFTSAEVNWADFTSELGWQALNLSPIKHLQWNEWKSQYYLPLVSYLKTLQEVKSYKVVSVTKRFLSKDEEIQGKSRFYDLFRIIYQLNPEEFINQQKENDPETYQKLSEEFIRSLQSSLEMYEDFDLIFDLRRETLPTSMAVTGRALGEGRITEDKISYGIEALKFAKTLKPTPEYRELALIGSSEISAEILIQLEDWLKEPRSRLFIITSEEDPYSEMIEKAQASSSKKLKSIISMMEEEFQKEVGDFYTRLKAWQALDDFIQVKHPKPVEPIPRLNFFSGHNVIAADQLIDRNRLFLTLEKPDFREGKKHPENNLLDLKTLGVDHILAANSLIKENLTLHLRSEEKGVFSITPINPIRKDAWKININQLKGIEDEIFKLFSPAHTH